MAKLVRVVAREEVGTNVQPHVGDRSEGKTIPGESSLTEPLAVDSCDLLPRSNGKETHSRETLRIKSGFLVPASWVVGNSLVFLFALCATTYLTAGLVRLFPWQNMLVSAVFLFFLTLFLPLTLFSLDWVKTSVNRMAYGTEEIITVPRWVRNTSVAKKLYWRVFLIFSLVFTLLAGTCFSLAFFSTRGTPGVNLFLGWFNSAFALYCMAIYFDVKKANTDQGETHL